MGCPGMPSRAWAVEGEPGATLWLLCSCCSCPGRQSLALGVVWGWQSRVPMAGLTLLCELGSAQRNILTVNVCWGLELSQHCPTSVRRWDTTEGSQSLLEVTAVPGSVSQGKPGSSCSTGMGWLSLVNSDIWANCCFKGGFTFDRLCGSACPLPFCSSSRALTETLPLRYSLFFPSCCCCVGNSSCKCCVWPSVREPGDLNSFQAVFWQQALAKALKVSPTKASWQLCLRLTMVNASGGSL